jgi:hypothetical protein
MGCSREPLPPAKMVPRTVAILSRRSEYRYTRQIILPLPRGLVATLEANVCWFTATAAVSAQPRRPHAPPFHRSRSSATRMGSISYWLIPGDRLANRHPNTHASWYISAVAVGLAFRDPSIWQPHTKYGWACGHMVVSRQFIGVQKDLRNGNAKSTYRSADAASAFRNIYTANGIHRRSVTWAIKSQCSVPAT